MKPYIIANGGLLCVQPTEFPKLKRYVTEAEALAEQVRLQARVEVLEGALSKIANIGNHWTGEVARKALATLSRKEPNEGWLL